MIRTITDDNWFSHSYYSYFKKENKTATTTTKITKRLKIKLDNSCNNIENEATLTRPILVIILIT